MNSAQTIKDKRLKIKLLKKAHKLIKSGDECYICCALEVAEKNPTDNKAGNELRAYVDKALNGCTFYTWWLRNHGYYTFDERKNKQGRLAWIDWMVACLEEDIVSLSK